MSQVVKAVLFDIGNVIVDWNPRYLYEQLIDDADRLDWFLRDVVNLAWHTHHDKGKPFAEGVADLSAQYPEEADLIALYDTRWDDTIKGTIDGTVTLIERLAASDVPLYGLTNFSAEKYPDFHEQYKVMHNFKGVMVSGEVGLVKPDPAIFNLTLERYGLKAEETLFIDDRMDNIIAAEKLGFKGHQFKSPEGLEACLKELALIS